MKGSQESTVLRDRQGRTHYKNYSSYISPFSGTCVLNPYFSFTRSPKDSAVSSSPCTTNTSGESLKHDSQPRSSAWSAWAEKPLIVKTDALTAISSPRTFTNLGSVNDFSAERSFALKSDKDDTALLSPEIVLKMMLYPAAFAHAASGNDDNA